MLCSLKFCIFHSPWYGMLPYYPKGQLQKLQRVQNAAARLVTNTRKYAHITPVLKSLHWLPVVTAFDIQNSSDHLSGIEVLITTIHQLTH